MQWKDGDDCKMASTAFTGRLFWQSAFLHTHMIFRTAEHNNIYSIGVNMAFMMLKDIGVGDGTLPNVYQ